MRHAWPRCFRRSGCEAGYHEPKEAARHAQPLIQANSLPGWQPQGEPRGPAASTTLSTNLRRRTKPVSPHFGVTQQDHLHINSLGTKIFASHSQSIHHIMHTSLLTITSAAWGGEGRREDRIGVSESNQIPSDLHQQASTLKQSGEELIEERGEQGEQLAFAGVAVAAGYAQQGKRRARRALLAGVGSLCRFV